MIYVHNQFSAKPIDISHTIVKSLRLDVLG